MTDIFDDLHTVDTPRLRVSLRIRGDALDPDFLTQHLGIAPTFTASKDGEPASDGRAVRDDTGLWMYRVDVPGGAELGDALGMLLGALPDDSTLFGEIVSAFTADVLCEAWVARDGQRMAVDADVLAALGKLGLPLSLELRLSDEDDEDTEH